MSYTDQPVSRGRTYAIIIVALLHALLAYAFVTGLAYRFVKGLNPDMKTFDVKEEPPPPPEEPPPPPPDQPSAPPMTAVQSPLPLPSPVPVPITPPAPYVPPVPIAAPPAPRPAPPPPPRVVPPQRARANLNSYFSQDDYPAGALRNNEQGTTGFALTIGPSGRVEACNVTSSSGSSALDQATCRILRSRARYTPARDENGNPTTGRDSGRVTWRLPAE
jgi:protein TonB